MSIHQLIEIPAQPGSIFEILTTSRLFERMTGGRKATIAPETGGRASLFDGDIEAVNVELVPGKRLVQAWRVASWPEGVYSIVRFELEGRGDVTRLTLDQSGHPGDTEEMLRGGWTKMYWEPMQEMLTS